jgi:hypothetical protein
MGWWRSATAEPGAGGGTVFAASLLLPLAGLALHLLGVRRALRLFAGDLHNLQCAGASAPEAAERVAREVERAGREYSVYPVDCLVRSLVVVWLLRRRGIAAELRLGVRTLTGRFEAHAWVEHCGVPLGEDADVARVFNAFEFPVPGALRSR